MKYSENPVQHLIAHNLLHGRAEDNGVGGLLEARSNSDLANYIVALEIAHKELIKMLEGWFDNADPVAVANLLADARNNWKKPEPMIIKPPEKIYEEPFVSRHFLILEPIGARITEHDHGFSYLSPFTNASSMEINPIKDLGEWLHKVIAEQLDDEADGGGKDRTEDTIDLVYIEFEDTDIMMDFENTCSDIHLSEPKYSMPQVILLSHYLPKAKPYKYIPYTPAQIEEIEAMKEATWRPQ